MNVSILGIGTALPAYAMEQSKAAEAAVGCCATDARQAKLLPEIFRRTTVRGRYSTLIRPGSADAPIDAETVRWFYPPRPNGNGHGETDADAEGEERSPDAASQHGPTTAQRMAHFTKVAPDLAEQATRRALAEAEVNPSEITHLVIVTCTGFGSPGVEHELIRRLDLPRHVKRTQVGFMGCHAALNGLQVAEAMGRTRPDAKVLMCCVELCTLHFQYGWNTEQLVPNALFADGSAAAVLGPEDSAAPSRRWRVLETRSRLFDGTDDAMTWHIGNHGFEMTLSPQVPGIVAENAGPWVEDWLNDHGLSFGDVAAWAIHPGGPRIVSGLADRLGLSESAVAASQSVLRNCGNMSSATVLFVLEKLWREGAGSPCVAMSFGPGLIAEGALLG